MSVTAAAVSAPARELAPPRRQPIVAWVNLVAAAAMMAGVLVHYGFNDDGLDECIKWLTPIGMVYFLAAFSARPLDDLLHTRGTSWLVVNRRYLGLSFAAWHLAHFPILTGFLVLDGPHTWWSYFGDFALPAGIVLLVITAMAATSTDRAQRWFGMRGWAIFHTIAIYLVWGWAANVYRQRVEHRVGIHNTVFFVIFLAAMTLRLAMAAKRLLKKPAR